MTPSHRFPAVIQAALAVSLLLAAAILATGKTAEAVGEDSPNAFITVVTIVTNPTDVGSGSAPKSACDFTMSVDRISTPAGMIANFPAASGDPCTAGTPPLVASTTVGVRVNPSAQFATFRVNETLPAPSGGASYVKTYSGVCGPDGTITVPLGANFPCIVTNTLVDEGQASPTALLTINTTVDYGQLNSIASACNFRMDLHLYDTVRRLDGSNAGSSFRGPPDETCLRGGTPLTATNNVGLATGTTTQAYHLSVDPLSTSATISIATFGGDCDSNGVVTLVAGVQKTCTVTDTLLDAHSNPASPTALLTVTKIVDRGQLTGAETACDFFINVDSYDSTQFRDNGKVAHFHGAPNDACFQVAGPLTGINNLGLVPGNNIATRGFKVIEDSPPVSGNSHYVVTYGGDCDDTGYVVVTAGAHKSCTVTNTLTSAGQAGATALLTVTKVVNRGQLGGNDSACDVFLSVDKFDGATFRDNGQVSSFHAVPGGVCTATNKPLTGTTNVGLAPTSGTAGHGFKVIEETNISEKGYGFFVAFSADCDASGFLNILAGEAKNCTVTNTMYDPATSEANPTALLTVTHVIDYSGQASVFTACDFRASVTRVSPTNLAVLDTIANINGAPHDACLVPQGPLTGINNVAIAPATGVSTTSHTYRVTETLTRPGFSLAYSGDCDAQGLVVIIRGATKSCTLRETLNTPPAFDPISTVTVAEDSGAKSVLITGVSAGPASESAQSVTVTAASSNTSVVPNPTVTGSGTTRTLSFTPVANASGSATITVTAKDGASGNNTFSRTFTVNVTAVEDADLAIDISASPDPAGKSRTVTYTVKVTNLGPDTASQPIVTLDTPSGTTFAGIVTPPPGGSVTPPATGGTGTWTAKLAPLPVGQNITFSYTLNILANAPAAISTGPNIVASGGQDPVATNNTKTLSIKVVDVGTFVLSPKNVSLVQSVYSQVCLQWTIPGGSWRTLKDIDIRVRTGTDTLAWIKFTEGIPNHQIALVDPRTELAGPAFPPGTANVLSLGKAKVNLAATTVTAAGPAAPDVQLCFSLQLNQPSGRTVYVVEAKATDDLGNSQDWQQAGTLTMVNPPR